MEWHRIRQSATKRELELARTDIPAVITARMLHAAKEAGADPARDRFVYVRRAGEWYVEFGLEVNAPDYAIEKLRKRGWEIAQ